MFNQAASVVATFLASTLHSALCAFALFVPGWRTRNWTRLPGWLTPEVTATNRRRPPQTAYLVPPGRTTR